jgi:hypothetical protein
MDVAAPKDKTFISVPAKRFIDSDSLNHVWKGFIWMNPPFGGRNSISPWLNKISIHGNGIALTPDRTSATWWQSAASRSDLILFIHGKVKFIRADGTIGKSPSTGTTLFAYGSEAVKALLKAEYYTLGVTAKFHAIHSPSNNNTEDNGK